MCNTLKSASHYLFVQRWRWEWIIKGLDTPSFSWSLPLNVDAFTTPFIYQGAAFIFLDADADAEKQFDIAI